MNGVDESVLVSLECSPDARKWFQGRGTKFIRNLGITNGQSILDFGCRVGHYTIPAAIVVGSTGRVFALDKDHDSIDILVKNTRKLGINNFIIPVKTSGELSITLLDDTIDAVFLYDIIHILIGINGTLKPLQLLLKEVSRVLKSMGLLSLTIDHLDKINYSKQDIIKEIEKVFTYQSSFQEEIMHWDSLKVGQVENYVLTGDTNSS